jgi:hypothetical protein
VLHSFFFIRNPLEQHKQTCTTHRVNCRLSLLGGMQPSQLFYKPWAPIDRTWYANGDWSIRTDSQFSTGKLCKEQSRSRPSPIFLVTLDDVQRVTFGGVDSDNLTVSSRRSRRKRPGRSHEQGIERAGRRMMETTRDGRSFKALSQVQLKEGD